MSPFKYLNTVCFQGAQFMYNHKQGGFYDKIKNTGHWGNVYNGVKKVRNGENAFIGILKKMPLSKLPSPKAVKLASVSVKKPPTVQPLGKFLDKVSVPPLSPAKYLPISTWAS